MFLTDDDLQPLAERLREANADLCRFFPGPSDERQPVHVVYGGAQLFKARTPARLGVIALDMLRTYIKVPSALAAAFAIDPSMCDPVYARIVQKLEGEPIEDYRIDFEDGYGYRPDSEEDGHAVEAGRQLAAGVGHPHFPPYCGLRIKPFTEASRQRSFRTFRIFMDALLDATGGVLPNRFVVTLPKVTSSEQVAVLAELLALFESRAGLPGGSMRMELMIETAQAIIDSDGRAAIPEFLRAARGRCRGMHFGAYDYTSDCHITAKYQGIRHPACDFARQIMQVCLAGTGVMFADSVTPTLPVTIHKGSHLSEQQERENHKSICHALRVAFDDNRNSLRNGFYQGWDLHPGQLISRYAAVYSFFLENLAPASARLKNFIDKAAQATTSGSAFDDAATAQGLLNFFLLGMNCGAITESEVLATGLSLDELRTRSFASIMQSRLHSTYQSA